MRVFRDTEEAKKFLGGHADLEVVPQAVTQRIEAIFGRIMTPQEVVSNILARVRSEGDSAIKELTQQIDGIELQDLEVSQTTLSDAFSSLPRGLEEALNIAAKRVTEFANVSVPKTWFDEMTGLGEKIVPLDRVGIYAPGGTAAYPSTVIMAVSIAKAVGVREVVLCTPARDGVNPNPSVLAAAQIAGVDRVFRIGGAQAVGAMAYGTQTLPKVDKICGPGNIFVTIAKQQLYGQVGIDGIFGPTETVVVADESADPVLCAADLLGQAEHDVMAAPIFITVSPALLDQVSEQIRVQVDRLERREIAVAALEGQGALILVESMTDAIDLANFVAPEHLCINTQKPWKLVPLIRNAGGVFLGEFSSEVMGDYVAGPSHTLPTHGTARFASYLGADQFVKRIPIVALSKDDAVRLAPIAATIAHAEGFTGHAKAAELRSRRDT